MADERTLVDRARAGDFEAFWELVEPLQDRIYRTVLRLVTDAEEAQDVVQETYLRAMRNLKKFRGESQFGTWVFSIALNLARNRWRKSQKMQSLDWDEVIPPGAHRHGDDTEDAMRLVEWKDPHRQLSQKRLGEVLKEGIESLPPKYRAVFLLKDVEEFSIKQIAEILKLSETAVKSRIVRARLAMRKFLEPHLAKEEMINARLPQNVG